MTTEDRGDRAAAGQDVPQGAVEQIPGAAKKAAVGKKAPAATKTPATKTPAKKTPAKKAPAKKAPATKAPVRKKAAAPVVPPAPIAPAPARRGVSEDEAFKSLRTLAMQRGIRLGEAARQVVDIAGLLG